MTAIRKTSRPATHRPAVAMLVAAAVGLWALPSAHAQEADSPAALLDLIRLIDSAEDISQAATRYSQARAIDADRADLYRAYMRKALLLGYPRIAFYPATELIRLEPDDPMAMSVIGYYHALRGNYTLAVPAYVTAAAKLPGDPSILFNLGNLLAWYDHMPLTPNLPDPVKQDISKNRKDWESTADFKTASKTAAPPFKKRTDQINKLKEQLDAHNATSDSLSTLAKRLQVTYRNNAAGIAACQRAQIETQDELDKLQFDTNTTGYNRLRKQRILNRQMAVLREREGLLKRDNNTLSGKLDQTLKELGSARTALDDARENLKNEESEMPALTWRPPTVDGRIVADAEPDGKPTIVLANTTAAASTQTDPAVTIKLARMLIQNGRPAKARESLQGLIAENPGTPAAKEAKELLATITKRDGLGTDHSQPDTKTYISDAAAPSTDTAPAPRAASDPEESLKMARALIRNRSHSQAVLILRTLLVNHPDCPAAEEAKVLLKGLQ